ncbi:MAG: hypothetical protein LBR36_00490 [Bacteroidales bacterium]|jgi:hypothetical protein|nr:hypothetical protein [Bacteroidales bacterium]
MTNPSIKFLWRVTAAHTIAYFIAGCFAMYIFNYKELFESNTLSLFMKPTTAPIVALGPALQIIRGLLIALILLPLRKVFTEEQYGFLKLGFLILGLSVLFTFSAASGSFEGLIYTTIPFLEQMVGYAEAILWISLFIGILWIFYRFEKKIINIFAIIFVILIVLMSVAGYLAAK